MCSRAVLVALCFFSNNIQQAESFTALHRPQDDLKVLSTNTVKSQTMEAEL